MYCGSGITSLHDEYRRAFATDCDRVVKEFALDGIDIDWEYPTSSMANISSSPDDTENFTLLMQDIRAAIGNEKELTLAHGDIHHWQPSR